MVKWGTSRDKIYCDKLILGLGFSNEFISLFLLCYCNYGCPILLLKTEDVYFKPKFGDECPAYKNKIRRECNKI